MIHVNNFANGALNPALSYVVSCVGCFLGLRCTTRARAYQGAARARWLTLAALSIGTTGIWVMHFIAMLGFAIPGETIRYNVPFTILSMVIAVIVVGIGVFIVGFSRRAGNGPLVLGGTILGLGVASMHYLGMGAVRVDASLSYNYGPRRGLRDHRGDRRHRGAVDGAAAGQRLVHVHRVPDRGRGGQRHALHGHGRGAGACRPGPGREHRGYRRARRRSCCRSSSA